MAKRDTDARCDCPHGVPEKIPEAAKKGAQGKRNGSTRRSDGIKEWEVTEGNTIPVAASSIDDSRLEISRSPLAKSAEVYPSPYIDQARHQQIRCKRNEYIKTSYPHRSNEPSTFTCWLAMTCTQTIGAIS